MRNAQPGDILWLDFDPSLGHEQAGTRPALVISNGAYNRLDGFAIVCPITSKRKGRRFEVPLTAAGKFSKSIVLADQLKSLDLVARNAKLAGKARIEDVDIVLGIAASILNIQVS
jgi:mRNA interferase MazF